MLEKIHKCVNATSRPIANSGTRKHTHRWINGVVQPRNELKIWNPQKMLLLQNSRETLAQLLNRRIRHLCTPYKRPECNDFYPKYVMYIWLSMFLSRWSKMIGYDNLICNVVWCYGYCLQASLLKRLFFFIWPLLHNAQTKIAIMYMWEQSCDTRDGTMIPRRYQYDMVCMQWKV